MSDILSLLALRCFHTEGVGGDKPKLKHGGAWLKLGMRNDSWLLSYTRQMSFEEIMYPVTFDILFC